MGLSVITDVFRVQERASKAYLPLLLPFAGYGIFIAESIFARPNPTWALVLLLWTFGAAAFAWWLATADGSRLLDSVDRHASRLAIALIAVAGMAFIVVSVMQARYFALSAQAEDTAYYSQILWNTLHGHFLSGNVQQERIYNPPVSTDLALHVSPIVLGLLPLYALVPNFLTLLILRDIALVAAAWPLYRLAAERMGTATAGLAAVVLYLANPAVVAQGAEAFYLLHFAPLPFFYAMLAFDREDFARFMCWMAAAIVVREDVTITLAGFGLWALVSRRRLAWVSAGLVIPAAWFALATLVIQPAFGRWGNGVMEIALAKSDQPRVGIFGFIWGNPWWFVDVMRDSGFAYLYRMLRSVGFAAAAGWDGVVALPGLAANLAVARIFYSGNDPISRFALLPACALIGASIIVVTRFGRRNHWDLRVLAVLALVLVPSASLLDGVKDSIRSRLALYTVRNDSAALREAVRLVPANASIAAPNYALPALSRRRELYYLPYLHMYPRQQPDYVLLDRNVGRVSMNVETQARYIALLSGFMNSTQYSRVWQRGDYVLLSRNSFGRQ